MAIIIYDLYMLYKIEINCDELIILDKNKKYEKYMYS